MIKIDLLLLNNNNLTIEEYLTLYKLLEISKGRDIPYNIKNFNINTLIEKKFLIDKDDKIFLTETSKKFLIFKEDEELDEVIEYFKSVTGKKRVSKESESNRRFIRGRINQGYSVDDCKSVIDVKTKEWKGSTMDQYLRIETLFNETKFQKYINEVESTRIETPKTNVRRI